MIRGIVARQLPQRGFHSQYHALETERINLMGASLTVRFSGVVQRVVDELAKSPPLLDSVRWGLEGGFRRHHQLIQKNFANPALRVLDCGCGTGIFSKHFSHLTYVGIDVSEIYLKRARVRNPGYRFEWMDAKQLRFPSEVFDAVITSGVIHHLEDDQARMVLSEIRRVLRPSGVFLLWEDVPTRQQSNVIGRTVHRFDQGDFIRLQSEYLSLLSDHFIVNEDVGFRSGFMDYAVFRCYPKYPKENGIDKPD